MNNQVILPPAIKTSVDLLSDNMWGAYQQKGEILEKPGLESVDGHSAMENFGMYVSADIATSFTLLVGIFFPSATGMTISQA